ncbi:MAG: FHA domain-containing protein [Nocardioidaceae bacterium]
MALRTRIDADLTLAVTSPGAEPTDLQMRLVGTGSHLELRVSDPALLPGAADAPALQGMAGAFARRGVEVTVTSDLGPLLTFGATHAPWWQRPFTRSRHIRLETLRALRPMARARRRQTSLLPSAELVPAPTLYPLAPTFLRRRRMPVTTTHDPSGGGEPRLIGAPGPAPWPGDRQPVFPLAPGVTMIGSDPRCDLVLEGLDPLQAEVRHTPDDEFVFVHLGRSVESLVNGERARERILRTSTRLEMGRWTLTYFREEYADHGRPYGGRLGGEIGHQRPQPPRHLIDPPAAPSGDGAA